MEATEPLFFLATCHRYHDHHHQIVINILRENLCNWCNRALVLLGKICRWVSHCAARLHCEPKLHLWDNDNCLDQSQSPPSKRRWTNTWWSKLWQSLILKLLINLFTSSSPRYSVLFFPGLHFNGCHLKRKTIREFWFSDLEIHFNRCHLGSHMIQFDSSQIPIYHICIISKWWLAIEPEKENYSIFCSSDLNIDHPQSILSHRS